MGNKSATVGADGEGSCETHSVTLKRVIYSLMKTKTDTRPLDAFTAGRLSKSTQQTRA